MSEIITERNMARLMIETDVVELAPTTPFVWSSGLRSPLYCDHRLLLARPDVRRLVLDALASVIDEHFETADAVGGVAVAAIPWAAWIAERADLPLVLARGKPKDHGHRRQIEGDLRNISSVIIVEDVVSTGGSTIRVAKALRKAGLSVAGVAAILDYQISNGSLRREGLILRALYTYDALRRELGAEGRHRDSLAALDRWRNSLESRRAVPI